MFQDYRSGLIVQLYFQDFRTQSGVSFLELLGARLVTALSVQRSATGVPRPSRLSRCEQECCTKHHK